MSHRGRRQRRPPAIADLKAVLAETAEAVETMGIDSEDLAGGMTAWTCGRAMSVMPTVHPQAPPEMHRWVALRARANLTGLCPVCGEMADVQAVTQVELAHRSDCPLIEPSDELLEWTNHSAVASLSAATARLR